MKRSVAVALMLLTVATADMSRAQSCSDVSPPSATNVCGGSPTCKDPACVSAVAPDTSRQLFGIIGLKGMKLNDIVIEPTWCAAGTGCLSTSIAIACPVPADNGGSHGCGVFQHEAGCYSDPNSQVIGGKLRFRPKNGFSVMPTIFTDKDFGWVDNDKQNVCLLAPRHTWPSNVVATNQLMIVDLPEVAGQDATPACAHSPKECSINKRVVDHYFYDPSAGDDQLAPLSGGSEAAIETIKDTIADACTNTARPSVYVGRVKNVGMRCEIRASGGGTATTIPSCRLTPATPPAVDTYYELTVTDKQTLTLAPGTYTFCKVTIDKGAKLLVDEDGEEYDTNVHAFDFSSRATSWVGADASATVATDVVCPGRLTIRVFDQATKVGKNVTFGSASPTEASVTLARVYAPDREVHLPEGDQSYIKGRYVGGWVYGADRAPFQYCEDPS